VVALPGGKAADSRVGKERGVGADRAVATREVGGGRGWPAIREAPIGVDGIDAHRPRIVVDVGLSAATPM
jgi:hypothetical protein